MPCDDAPELSRAEVCAALLQIAARAEALDSPAGLATARAAWVDAARVAGLLAPAPAPEPADAETRRARLSELEVRRAAMERE